MKPEFNKLTAGIILRNRKNGNIFEVLGFLDDELKCKMKNLKTQEIIKVTERTYRCFWHSFEEVESANI